MKNVGVNEILLLLLLLVVGFAFGIGYDRYKINSCPKYTVGAVIRYENTGDGEPKLVYQYFADTLSLEGSTVTFHAGKRPDLHDCFWVKYSCNDPGTSIMLLDKPAYYKEPSIYLGGLDELPE